MTYLLISAPFLLAAAALWARRRPWKLTAAVAGILFVLTIVFDNLMVAAGLYEFGHATTLGLNIGRIPVEDLFYPLFTALVVTAFWGRD
ncbi:lycopene cyclase domain-containing protein [Corynebacterium sp. CCUG 70398]|uniref:lycopene cyclase domain-containing protein n=1 Tax=Corynebacterium sp. CCUG 70398 TaxID=2823891 RepID=UPI00210C270B|nr:lycopene cyclase domain-containing protein [Corynebacterium sp. CCUG 70398]